MMKTCEGGREAGREGGREGGQVRTLDVVLGDVRLLQAGDDEGRGLA